MCDTRSHTPSPPRSPQPVSSPPLPPATTAAPAAAAGPARAPRGRSCTFHVDLGPALKAAVLATAERRGVRPSDWVRQTLSRAVSGYADPSGGSGPGGPSPGRVTTTAAARSADTRTLPLPGYEDWPALPQAQPSALADLPEADPSAARFVGIHLAPADIELLDQLVAAGGLRSRPAALRFLLRTLRLADTRRALSQLPRTVVALMESNLQLQLSLQRLGRLAQSPHETRIGAADSQALRREVRQHLEEVAHVLAALRPLLASGPTTPSAEES